MTSSTEEALARFANQRKLDINDFESIGRYRTADAHFADSIKQQKRDLEQALRVGQPPRRGFFLRGAPGDGKTFFIREFTNLLAGDSAQACFETLNILASRDLEQTIRELGDRLEVQAHGRDLYFTHIDEVHAVAGTDHAYRFLLPLYDRKSLGNVVWFYSGSRWTSLEELHQDSAPSLPDLLSRVTPSNVFALPNISSPMERLVRAVSIAWENRIEEIERTALAYFVLTGFQDMREMSARLSRACAAAAHSGFLSLPHVLPTTDEIAKFLQEHGKVLEHFPGIVTLYPPPAAGVTVHHVAPPDRGTASTVSVDDASPAVPAMRPTRVEDGGGILSSALPGHAVAHPSQPLTKVQTERATPITVRYADLLNRDAVTRTGARLGDVLGEAGSRSEVLRFVRGYSELLPLALEMMQGPRPQPEYSLMHMFPDGEAEPAWVAIVRGGAVHVSMDGQTRVRVFVEGDEPKESYVRERSVLRHCLGTLASLAGNPLGVEVFSYRNRCEKAELSLNPTPYCFTASAKSLGPDRKSLDLEKLRRFFEQGSVLTGGSLTPEKGFILAGPEAPRQTLASQPLDLSDFAVAYRAILHAKDDPPFVSIDPAGDPTRAKVNFGGYLANTRIGWVMLQADKRFKTFTPGLDPDSGSDARAHVREHVPDFLTSPERSFLEPRVDVNGWVWTRLWFYADGITSLVDASYDTARIVSAQFTAGAERSRANFASAEEYEHEKQSKLLPAHRATIDHLNQQYPQYARVFPELAELQTVARLLMLCAWISKGDRSWLDCDALMTVEVPFCRTETERSNLIATTLFSHLETENIDPQRVIENTTLVNLSDLLNGNVADYFQEAQEFEEYLRSMDCGANEHEARVGVGEQEFAEYKDRPLRELFQSRAAFEAFVSYAGGRIRAPGVVRKNDLAMKIALSKRQLEEADVPLREKRAKLEDSRRRLAGLKDEIEELDRLRRMSTGGTDLAMKYDEQVSVHNELVEEYNLLKGQYNAEQGSRSDLLAAHNRMVDEHNALIVWTRRMNEIAGGIDAHPSSFTFQEDTASRELMELKEVVESPSLEFTSARDERWIRSESAVKDEATGPLDSRTDVSALKRRIPTTTGPDASKRKAFWRIEARGSGGSMIEKAFDQEARQLFVREYEAGRLRRAIVGCLESDGLIVFRPMRSDDRWPDLTG